MLYLKCEGQVMRVEVDERIADKYINANTVHFEFCERWDGMVITAQFTQNGHTYNKVVDAVTNTVILPNEIVAGTVEISAFGEHPTTGVRITSIAVKKTVDKSGFVGDGETPIPPTPDLYAQLLDKVNKTAIPHIGANGNWWFDDYDSGVAATAELETAKQAAVNEINRQAANALATLPDDYVTLSGDVNQLKDHKANVIIDTSARAASHSLHAQDGRLAVTLYGKTTETGTGDKSPDNPYVISGEGVVHFLFNGSENWKKSSLAVEGYSSFYLSDTRFIDNRDFVICDTFRMGNYWEWSNLVQDEFIEIATGSVGIRVKNERATDLTTWKAWLASNPVNAWCQVKRGEAVDSVAVGLSGEGGRTAIGMPLLPDGAPLHGNGTVDDTVENDVLSGCDVAITFDGSEDWTYSAPNYMCHVSNGIPNTQSGYSNLFTVFQSNKDGLSFYGGNLAVGKNISAQYATVDDWKAYLAANPLTVYYRSTEYTPEKDLRVCRAVRNFYHKVLTGEEYVTADDSGKESQTFRIPLTEYTVSGYNGTLPIYSNRYNFVAWNNSPWSVNNSISYVGATAVRIKDTRFATAAEFKAYLADLYAAGTPVEITYQLGTPETYMTDTLPLRKPTGMEEVTVTGSAETAVTYPCDTKSYIDRKFDALAAALLS